MSFAPVVEIRLLNADVARTDRVPFPPVSTTEMSRNVSFQSVPNKFALNVNSRSAAASVRAKYVSVPVPPVLNGVEPGSVVVSPPEIMLAGPAAALTVSVCFAVYVWVAPPVLVTNNSRLFVPPEATNALIVECLNVSTPVVASMASTLIGVATSILSVTGVIATNGLAGFTGASRIVSVPCVIVDGTST